MSVQAITWALGKAPNLASQAVLFALANHANEWGITFVGQDTVAEECSCRRATVTANVTKLEEAGLVARFHRRDAGGRRTSDVIVVAPLAADRGALRDAEKQAASMFAPEVCAAARQCPSSVPRVDSQSASHESLGTPNGRLGTPSVHEPSEEPSEEPSATENAREKVDLPEGFPNELRPHLRAVFVVLRDLSRRHEAREVKPISLASVVMARPRKPLVRSAHDFAAWADGRAQRQRDVVASYRNWLDRTDDMATVERLSEQGVPASANGNGNGNGHHANGRPVGLLERQVWPDGRTWAELTEGERIVARDAASRGGRPWEAPEELDTAPRVSTGKGVTATTWLLPEND